VVNLPSDAKPPATPATVAWNDLVVRPQRRPGESAGGFVLRVANENGLGRPAWLGSSTGSSPSSPGLGRARWCPACLGAADAWWQQAWTAGPAVCEEHGSWLEDRCPGCSHVVGWRGLRLRHCGRCDASLDAAGGRSLWSDSVKALRTTPTDPSSPGWASLSVPSRWRLAAFLGALDRHGLAGKPLKRASAAIVEVERSLVTAGADLLAEPMEAEPTEGLGGLFSRLQRPGAAGSTPLIGEAFPGLLPRMRAQLPADARHWLEDRLAEHVGASLESDKAVVWRRRTASTVQGATAVAKTLRVRPERMGTLAALLPSAPAQRQTATGRTMLGFAPVAIDQLRLALEDRISVSAAADRYGLAAARLRQLARAGLVARTGDRLSRSSIEALLARLSAVAERCSAEGQGACMALPEALRWHVRNGDTTSFFERLLAGQIAVQAAEPIAGEALSGFRGLALRAEDVGAKSRKPDDTGLLTAAQAAQALGLKSQVVYQLLSKGLLRALRRRIHGRFAQFIEATEVERFRGQFRPLSAVFPGAGRSAPELALAAGMELVCGPSVDGLRQYFVRCEGPASGGVSQEMCVASHVVGPADGERAPKKGT